MFPNFLLTAPTSAYLTCMLWCLAMILLAIQYAGVGCEVTSNDNAVTGITSHTLMGGPAVTSMQHIRPTYHTWFAAILFCETNTKLGFLLNLNVEQGILA